MPNGSIELDKMKGDVDNYVEIYHTIIKAREDLAKYFQFGIPDQVDGPEKDAIGELHNSIIRLQNNLDESSTELCGKELPKVATKVIDSCMLLCHHILQHASDIENEIMVKEAKKTSSSFIKIMEILRTKVSRCGHKFAEDNEFFGQHQEQNNRKRHKNKQQNFQEQGDQCQSNHNQQLPLHNFSYDPSNKIVQNEQSSDIEFVDYGNQQQQRNYLPFQKDHTNTSLQSQAQPQSAHHALNTQRKKPKRILKKTQKILQNEELVGEEFKAIASDQSINETDKFKPTASKEKQSSRRKSLKKSSKKESLPAGETKNHGSLATPSNHTKKKHIHKSKKKTKDVSHLDSQKINSPTTENEKNLRSTGKKRRRSCGDKQLDNLLSHVTEPNTKPTTSAQSTPQKENDEEKIQIPAEPKNSVRTSQTRSNSPLSVVEQRKKKEKEILDGKIKEYLEKIKDPCPKRLTNPLLSLPPFPDMPTPPIDLIPNGAEFWNIIQLYFPKPQSFSISTIASILGFEVSPTPSLQYPSVSSNSESNTDQGLNANEIKKNKFFVGKGLEFDPNAVSLRCLSKDKNGRPKDPFLHIPSLGNVSQLCQKRRSGLILEKNKVHDDDAFLDFIDKSWLRILNQFRDPNAKENLKLATDMAHLQAFGVNTDCIRKARSSQLISEDINFRIAVLGDEDKLVKFNKDGKDQTYHSTQSIITIIKCCSQRIILAERKDGTLLSFIHYSFNWYMLKCDDITNNGKNKPNNDNSLTESHEKKSASRKEYPELVAFINRVGNGEDFGEGEILNISITLIALAINHAQLSNVFYGLVNANKSTAELYTQLFRMRTLSKDNGTSTIPVACDMVMCSFDHTFLRKLEMDSKRKEQIVQEKNTDDMKQRMIVHLPKVKDIMCNPQLENGTTINTKSIVETEKSPEAKPQQPKTEKYDTIRVKLDLKDASPFEEVDENDSNSLGPNKDMSKDILRISSSISKGSNNTNDLLDEKTFSYVDNDDLEISKWKVLRVFPNENIRPNVCDRDENILTEKKDNILSELEKTQLQLIELEKKMEPKLRDLLNKVINFEQKYVGDSFYKEKQEEEKKKKEYGGVLKRRQEAQLAWEAQLEQDMDAVCDVCSDGEITIDNQILFCEACNVAVHQKCYGIDSIPDGDWFCKACRYFKRHEKNEEKKHNLPTYSTDPPPRSTPVPLPIHCELCPRTQGAYVKTQVHNTIKLRKRKVINLPPDFRWVHVVCAKWQGLNYVDRPVCEFVEDVQPIKRAFQDLGYECKLCESKRGGMNNCAFEGCTNWMHVTCARSSGICKVTHGDCYDGSEVENPWTLFCPDHSEIEKKAEGSLSIEQLKDLGKAFPPDPKPLPEPKPFWKLNGKERKEHLKVELNEEMLFESVMDRLEGLRCSVCHLVDNNCDPRFIEEDNNNAKNKDKKINVDDIQLNALSICTKCGSAVHLGCYQNNPDALNTGNTEFICESCRFTEENSAKEEFESPRCHMCNHEQGLLVKAFATVGSKKKWSNKQKFKKSLFGKQIWCHAVCGMWHPNCNYQNHEHKDKLDSVDCTNIIMADGQHHISSNHACKLCGRFDKAKVSCADKRCIYLENQRKNKLIDHFHLSCARQAGLDVSDQDDNSVVYFKLRCFRHSRCDYSLRAKLEDMMEFERTRSGLNLDQMNSTMSISHATSLINLSVTIMACLGWAWRWAEWWVENGDNWEPLIEEHQNEATMSKEELRIIDSTPESRCTDARKCRLAAFGAALRNRSYDNENGVDSHSLDRALRAILHTQSLVGPLGKVEIDFFATWLGMAYRYKSPLLGFGKDAIPVSDTNSMILHKEDRSKKSELGNRPLPGKQVLAKGKIFEEVIEVDDFLKVEASNATIVQSQKKTVPKENLSVGNKKPNLKNGKEDALPVAKKQKKILTEPKWNRRKLVEKHQLILSSNRNKRKLKQTTITVSNDIKTENETIKEKKKQRSNPAKPRLLPTAKNYRAAKISKFKEIKRKSEKDQSHEENCVDSVSKNIDFSDFSIPKKKR